MRTFRIGALEALQAGSLNGAAGDSYGEAVYGGSVYGAQDLLGVDILFDARSGQPALVPAPLWSTAFYAAQGDPQFSYTGGWSGGVTTTPGSAATLTFAGYGCVIFLVADLLPAGIAFVTVDGAPYPAIDTSIPSAGPLPSRGTRQVATLAIAVPTGGTHSVVLTYYGDINAAIGAVGSPANTVGTSVAGKLLPARLVRGATVGATYTVQATDATHVEIDGAGSYALGTTVSGVIPGVALTLAAGTMTAGDRATITTVATGIAVQAAYVATAQATGGVYTSPVVSADGTLPATGLPLPLAEPGGDVRPLQWLAATWEEAPAAPVTTGNGATGNTLNPADPAWAIAAATDDFDPSQLAIGHDGLGGGVMGLAALPPGAYCQVSLFVPTGGYIRNLRLYAWDPAMDADARRYPPVPGRDNGDDLAMRLYGALAVAWTILERDPMRELLVSCSAGSAVGALLDRHGAEWDLPRPFGMGDAAYAALLRFLSAARTRGGTLGFYQQALALLLGPGAVYTLQSLAGTASSWVLGTSRLGVDTALGSFTPGAWQALLSVRVASISIPPQTISQIVELFRPVGVNLTIKWQ